MSEAERVVAPPPLDADEVLLADWLELVAFLGSKGVARLDEIDNALTIQDEESAVDDAAADSIKDGRREGIENEITRRSVDLGESYPFVLSDDGEELAFKGRGERSGACFYIACLIISHFKRSQILDNPPADEDVARVRKRHFQILATLAVAGHAGGPAVSFGWPRANGESITDAVQRCCEFSGTGLPRTPPGPEASESAKDGGMDVIAWRPAVNDQPPPSMMFFGQAASGHNWSAKSAVDELEMFLEGYFTNRPACTAATVTVVPHRLSAEQHQRFGRKHGHILDRLRTPKAALIGFRMAKEGGVAIDEADAAHLINCWLLRYRRSLRTN